MVGSQQTALVDKLLTSFSNKITPEGFIAEKILPLVNVMQSSGKILQYGTSGLRITTSLTTGKNGYNQIDTGSYSTLSYQIEKHGLKDVVTEETQANVQDPADAFQDSVEAVTDSLRLEKEKGLADLLGNTAVITQNTTLSGTSQYNDYTNSTPLTDFITARETVRQATGMKPDTVVLSAAVAEYLRYHPDFLTALGYNNKRPDGLTDQEMAKVMKVKRVLIGEAVYESAAEGLTSSVADIWGKNIIFMVAPTSAKKRQVSLGYRFQMFGDSRRVFKNTVDEPPRAVKIQVDDHYDQMIVMVGAAYLIKDAVA